MDIFNNPWITGIGGGTISGLIVYFVTERLLSKKQNREYTQKIMTANNELLYTMRPLIVQKEIPSNIIINSIIESTARKYQVNKNDLLDVVLLTNDLIREVMENAFLDSKQKMEFCNKINELKSETLSTKEVIQTYQRIVYQKDRISSEYVSTLLAVTATTMVFAVSIFTTMKNGVNIDFNGLDNLSEISSITLIGIIVPMIAMITTMFLKNMKKYENNIKKNEEYIKKDK